MVVDQEEKSAREEFRDWFQAEAKRIGAEGRGAIATLHRKLSEKAGRKKPLVTQQQLRKYFRGIDYPKPDTLRQLCEQLEFRPPPSHFARMVEIKAPRAAADPLHAELMVAWSALDTDDRRDIVDYARWKAFSAHRGAREYKRRSAG